MKMIKLYIMSLFLLIFSFNLGLSQVAINTDGTAPNASSMLDVTSTSRGLLIPRMLETERTAITLPVQGLLVYQTNSKEGFYYYSGSSWLYIGNEDNDLWTRDSGNGFTYIANSSDDVGIGTSSPNGILHIDNGAGNTDFILEKDAGTFSNIIFDEAGTQQAKITFDANEDLIFEHDKQDQDIIFKINDGGSDNEILRIDGSETRVGINTSSPNLSLAVNGHATSKNLISTIPLWQASSAYNMTNTAGQDLTNCESALEPSIYEPNGYIEVKLIIRYSSISGTNNFQLRAHDGTTESYPIVNTDSWNFAVTQTGGVATSSWKIWNPGTNANEVHLNGWTSSGGHVNITSAYLLIRPKQP